MSDVKTSNLVTQVAMLSYPWLDRPQKPQKDSMNQTPKYSAVFVFEEGTDLSELRAAAIEVAKAKWGDTVKLPAAGGKPGKVVSMEDAIFKLGIYRHPFRNDGEAKGYPEGSTFINARSERQPGMVYLWPEPGTNPPKPAKIPLDKIREVLYPGCKVRGLFNAFAYEGQGGKPGVSFALQHVQKMGEGERLDSRIAAEDAFEVDLNAEPASLEDLDDLMGE
jgi:hypothetical protein